jgi:hypothetical protein
MLAKLAFVIFSVFLAAPHWRRAEQPQTVNFVTPSRRAISDLRNCGRTVV